MLDLSNVRVEIRIWQLAISDRTQWAGFKKKYLMQNLGWYRLSTTISNRDLGIQNEHPKTGIIGKNYLLIDIFSLFGRWWGQVFAIYLTQKIFWSIICITYAIFWISISLPTVWKGDQRIFSFKSMMENIGSMYADCRGK